MAEFKIGDTFLRAKDYDTIKIVDKFYVPNYDESRIRFNCGLEIWELTLDKLIDNRIVFPVDGMAPIKYLEKVKF